MVLETDRKYIVLVRHGPVDNPNDLAYCRDTLTEQIHLSEAGREKVHETGVHLKKLGLEYRMLRTSPETRAIETSEELKKILGLMYFVDRRLDDAKCVGPFRDHIPMSVLKNEYQENIFHPRWSTRYHQESPDQIVLRFSNGVNFAKALLKPQEAAVIVSHGAPISLYLRLLQSGPDHFFSTPFPPLAPDRGSASVLEFSARNNFIGQQPFLSAA